MVKKSDYHSKIVTVYRYGIGNQLNLLAYTSEHKISPESSLHQCMQ